MFNIFHWTDSLTTLLHRSRNIYAVHYDARDLSRVYIKDHLNEFIIADPISERIGQGNAPGLGADRRAKPPNQGRQSPQGKTVSAAPAPRLQRLNSLRKVH